ncbi:MAG: glutathione-disulfide reductase [Maricaulaceae bacterium]|jgi:glutathione reductase (NADPH)
MAGCDYDLFVIGAGSGGVRAARVAASAHGKKVAVAEEYRVGGTCVIRGCVPKKFLVYASEFGAEFEHAKSYGWSLPAEPSFDWSKLIAAKDAEIDRLSGIYWRNLENAGVEVIEDRATFLDPHTLKLEKSGRTVTAETILIATGARPSRPREFEGQELAITSNEAFHLKELPRRVVVAGGGYIACEFAAIFNGLGAETTLLYRRDTVLRGFDMDVRTEVHEELKRKGVRVITHAVFASIGKADDGSLIGKLDNDMTLEADAVMFAIGRNPNTEGLGLEAAGVAIADNGAVVVDDYSRTSAAHIYAIGDVTDRLQLTPVAIREAEAFVSTAFGGAAAAFDHRMVPSAVFTQPAVGVVGYTEADARKEFGEIDVYKTKFRSLKNTLTGDEEKVFYKLIVRRSDQVVIGCHLVSPDAGELIQLAGVAVKAGLTKKSWDETCAVHPTASEELVTLREPWHDPELAAE